MTRSYQDIKKWRRRLRRKSYVSTTHPRAPWEPGPYVKKRGPAKFSMNSRKKVPGSFRRQIFAEKEIEAMWLALCTLLDYCNGSKQFLSELTGISINRINRYIKNGRVTAEAAHIIGLAPDLPFSRESLRPDISEKGWEDFDKFWKQQEHRQLIQKIKTARRIESS